MRFVLYDCTDQRKGLTLRLIDDNGRMPMQAHFLGDGGRRLANRIVEALAISMDYVGPATRQPDPLLTLDPPVVYEVPAKPAAVEIIHARDRNQLALF